MIDVGPGNETVANEARALFGNSSCSASVSEETFASRAEKLCDRVLANVGSSNRRRKRSTHQSTPYSRDRVKEWTKNVVLIDYQGPDENKPLPLYDYHKLFDGLMKLSSDMSESDVRGEIVRLVHLKKIVTHRLDKIQSHGFSFVRVYNRRVRPVDGDMPCDGSSIAHMYKNGSVYVRLKDESLWAGNQVLIN